MKRNQFLSNINAFPFFLYFENLQEISKEVAYLPWNCVITSSTEEQNTICSLFANTNRTVFFIEKMEELLSLPLGKNKLYILRVDNSKIEDEFEVIRFKTDFQKVLSYLKNRLGNGFFVFEHFPNNNTILSELFKTLIIDIPDQRILSFSKNDSKNINDFLTRKKAYLFKESLKEYISSLSEEDFPGLYIQKEDSVHIYLNGKVQAIPGALYRSVIDYCDIMTLEEINKIQVPQSFRKEYFYQFLQNSAKETEWYGYANEFNYVKDQDIKITNEVFSRLNRPSDTKKKAFIIYGQSGSGKTILLNNISYKVFTDKQYPVIRIKSDKLAKNVTVRNILNDKQTSGIKYIEQLIQELRKFDLKNLLLVWDLSLYSIDYEKIYAYFYGIIKNFGINFVLLCSGYDSTKNSTFEFIEIPVLLSDDKLPDFTNYLVKNSYLSKYQIDNVMKNFLLRKSKCNLFSLFYQLIYVTQPSLQKGIKIEASYTIEKVIENFKSDEPELGIMEFALQKAGIHINKDKIDNSDSIQNGIYKLLIISSLCSKYSVSLPVDLAFRLVQGNFNNIELITSIAKIPFYRYTIENEEGIGFFEVRTQLEAEIILKCYNISPEEEVNFICEILKTIRTVGITSDLYENIEIKCVADLLHNIGPNIKANKEREKINKKNFMPFYTKIFETFDDVEENLNTPLDPRLALAKVTFMRELAIDLDKNPNGKNVELLKKAIKISQAYTSAFSSIDYLHYNQLKSEEGNCRIHLYDVNKSFQELVLAKEAAEEILSTLNDNVHAISLWLRASLKEIDELSGDKKAQNLADMVYFVNSRRSNYDLDDDKECLGLFQKVYEQIQRNDEFFNELIAKKNSFGIYLKSIYELNKNEINIYLKEDNKTIFSNNELKHIQVVLNNILLAEENKSISLNSTECIFLIIQLKWFLLTNKSFFRVEKQKVFLSNKDTIELLSYCELYDNLRSISNSTERNNMSVQFLKALCYYYNGNIRETNKIIRDIRDFTDKNLYPNRNYIRNILCDENGNIKLFDGKIIRRENKFFLQVTGFQEADILVTRTTCSDIYPITEGLYERNFAIGLGLMGFHAYHGNIVNDLQER